MAAAECPSCGQKIKETATTDESTRPKRAKLVISVPLGEEGVLDDLLIQFVERFKPMWDAPLEGSGSELPQVGDRHWKYMALHHGLYALLTADEDTAARLLPSEIGG